MEFVWAHRALRPKGPDTAPPRDIICWLQNFNLKEEIMRKARRNYHIVFNGESIMLFQGLSQITLRNRRTLRPLLEKLRKKELKYIRSDGLLLWPATYPVHTERITRLLRGPEPGPHGSPRLVLGIHSGSTGKKPAKNTFLHPGQKTVQKTETKPAWCLWHTPSSRLLFVKASRLLLYEGAALVTQKSVTWIQHCLPHLTTLHRPHWMDVDATWYRSPD